MLSLLPLLAFSVVSAPSAFASAVPGYHAPHSVEHLFRRDTPIPDVGSAAWTALYPSPGTTPSTVPQAWTDALAAAVSKGLIPDIPPATLTEGIPTYSNGLDPTGSVACHNTLGCSIASDKLYAPDGMIGISQDDGPLPPGRTLNSFFKAQNINATHFYIGGNVVGNSDIFLQARDIPGQHFAVHTWTHPYMSGLSNEGVVAELGWTMQILADSNYGLIPGHWRPPYGDVDNRVRAIAKEVFGLQTVIWGPDKDTEDWTLTNLDNEEAIKTTLKGFLESPKSPGLIMLQHELSDRAVDAFISLWPQYLSNGWDCRNIPDLWSEPWYKNAFDSSSKPVAGITVVSQDGANATLPNASSSAAPSSSAGASSAGGASSSSAASGSQSSARPRSSVAASASAAAASGSASAVSAQTGGAISSSRSVGVAGVVGLASVILFGFCI